MPMAVKTREEYDEVLGMTWYVDERAPEEITYVSGFTFRG
jgi:hypothetical protein